MNTVYSLVVQCRTEGWGSADDLDNRHHLEDLLDACLQSNNDGMCDGGDIGSGTMNIYLENIVDPDRATAAVIETLKNAQALEGAILALRRNSENEEDYEDYTVVWPPDFQGEFSVI